MQRKEIIGKHQHLVHLGLVVADQVLCRHELVWIANTQLVSQIGFVGFQILSEEVWRHFAPHLRAVHSGNVARVFKVHPVCLVQLGTDKKVKVFDLVVLTHQRCCQAELAVARDDGEHLPGSRREREREEGWKLYFANFIRKRDFAIAAAAAVVVTSFFNTIIIIITKITNLNSSAGTVCTSSRIIKPHSRLRS